MNNQPPLNPDALDKAALAMYAENPRPTGCFSPPFVAWHELRDGEREVIREGTYTAVSAYLAAALPEVTSVEELAKAWHAGFCKGEQTAFRERPVNPDTINPYKNGEKP